MTNVFALDCFAKHPLEPAPWELPGHDCRCGNELAADERHCIVCRAEAAQLARVVLPALDELMWRRRLNSIPSAIVDSDTARADARGSVGTPTVTAGAIPVQGGSLYDVITCVGSLALLGVSLGSLAPLAAMLGAVS